MDKAWAPMSNLWAWGGVYRLTRVRFFFLSVMYMQKLLRKDEDKNDEGGIEGKNDKKRMGKGNSENINTEKGGENKEEQQEEIDDGEKEHKAKERD